MSGSSNGCTNASPCVRALERLAQALVDGVAALVDDRRVPARRRHLGRGRLGGHEAPRSAPRAPRRPRRAPGRGCRPTRRRRRGAVRAERGELGSRPANLERAGALQVLGLQRHGAAGPQRQRAGAQHRRVARDRAHRLARARSMSSALTALTAARSPRRSPPARPWASRRPRTPRGRAGPTRRTPHTRR